LTKLKQENKKMSFDPKKIKSGVQKKPRKVLLYGAPKLGKTTLAASAKDSFLIYTENRVDPIDNAKAPELATSLEYLNEALEWLIIGKNNGEHPYKRIIIDSMDWLEPLIHQAVCEKIGVKSLIDQKDERVNFGRGLKFEAVYGWKTFLSNCDLLQKNGFDVILIAHDQTIQVSPADAEPYDKQTMKIDKHALAVLEEWADIIGYYTKPVLVKTSKTASGKLKGLAMSLKVRALYLSGDNPSFMSGNSYNFGDIEIVNENQCQEVMEYILTQTGK
jgi:hypothetical protein